MRAPKNPSRNKPPVKGFENPSVPTLRKRSTCITDIRSNNCARRYRDRKKLGQISGTTVRVVATIRNKFKISTVGRAVREPEITIFFYEYMYACC